MTIGSDSRIRVFKRKCLFLAIWQFRAIREFEFLKESACFWAIWEKCSIWAIWEIEFFWTKCLFWAIWEFRAIREFEFFGTKCLFERFKNFRCDLRIEFFGKTKTDTKPPTPPQNAVTNKHFWVGKVVFFTIAKWNWNSKNIQCCRFSRS